MRGACPPWGSVAETWRFRKTRQVAAASSSGGGTKSRKRGWWSEGRPELTLPLGSVSNKLIRDHRDVPQVVIPRDLLVAKSNLKAPII